MLKQDNIPHVAGCLMNEKRLDELTQRIISLEAAYPNKTLLEEVALVKHDLEKLNLRINKLIEVLKKWHESN